MITNETAMRSVRGIVIVLLAALGVVAFDAVPAGAHTASTYFTDGHWPRNQSIAYGVNSGFPTGTWRTLAWNGKEQWNSATNTGEPTIYWTLADDVSYGSATSPCGVPGYNTGAIFWNDLDYLGPSVLGATRLCGFTPIFNFTIEFDRTRTDWYVGTGDAPGGSYDFWSVASHEFGHALGFWKHLDEADAACPNDSTRSTMCPSVYDGTERQRTLATHDIHTFDAAYN